MTIFVTWQLRVTLDSIHNSCNVLVELWGTTNKRVPRYYLSADKWTCMNQGAVSKGTILSVSCSNKSWTTSWYSLFWFSQRGAKKECQNTGCLLCQQRNNIDSALLVQMNSPNILLNEAWNRGIIHLIGNQVFYELVFCLTRVQTRVWQLNRWPCHSLTGWVTFFSFWKWIFQKCISKSIFSKSVFLESVLSIMSGANF